MWKSELMESYLGALHGCVYTVEVSTTLGSVRDQNPWSDHPVVDTAAGQGSAEEQHHGVDDSWKKTHTSPQGETPKILKAG